MNLMHGHLDTIGGLADLYLPGGGAGAGDADGNGGHDDARTDMRPVGEEQIRISSTDTPPRIIENHESGFPRLQKFYEYDQFLNYVDWSGNESQRGSHGTTPEIIKHTQTHNFEEAMNLARFGWVDGLKQISKIPPIQLPRIESLRPSYEVQTQYDIAGGAVNIGKYLAGEPDCMRRMQIPSGHDIPSRIQKILIVNNSYLHTTIQSIIQYGSMIYQIIDALEMANIRTEITFTAHANKMAMFYETDYDFYEKYIKIKNAGDRMSPEKLLFVLAHPSFFRRLCSSEGERNPSSIRNKFGFKKSCGYGAYIPTWQPPESMMRDTILIHTPGSQDQACALLRRVEDLIKSQYEKMR